MKRREFSTNLLGAGAAALVMPGVATAQGGFVEGQHYIRLTQPVPTTAGPGKIELIEFFWYGCPHCAAFEPAIEPWIARQPKDKVFVHRVHVAFNARQQVHQRLWAALDSMGVPDSVHGKVFKRFHVPFRAAHRVAPFSRFRCVPYLSVCKIVHARSARAIPPSSRSSSSISRRARSRIALRPMRNKGKTQPL